MSNLPTDGAADVSNQRQRSRKNDPIMHHLRPLDDGAPVVVIGLVGDVEFRSDVNKIIEHVMGTSVSSSFHFNIEGADHSGASQLQMCFCPEHHVLFIASPFALYQRRKSASSSIPSAISCGGLDDWILDEEEAQLPQLATLFTVCSKVYWLQSCSDAVPSFNHRLTRILANAQTLCAGVFASLCAATNTGCSKSCFSQVLIRLFVRI